MTRGSNAGGPLDLVLAVHAGVLELDEIDDVALRDEVRTLHMRLSEFSSEGLVDGDHLPEWLVAGWPALGSGLSTLERELIEAHFESCAECRQELEILGAARRVVEATPRRARAGASPAFRLTLGWAVVATAASLILLFRSPPMPGPSEPVELTLPASLRGEGAVASATLADDTSRLRLDFGQIYPGPRRQELINEGATGVLLSVRAQASGGASHHAERSTTVFRGDPVFELRNAPGEVFAPGRYECVLWILRGDEATVGERAEFELGAPDDRAP